ncbi:MAG: hypothetical protein H8E44_09680 [Planctomycetes bacterium]|nr:hypothetical protein [Planctomycetota bacterium]MBL7042472.1 hypothetical protein [Pirellulaceae bacterium]
MMTSRYPFGNDPAKVERYKAFWNREAADRPLAGFSFVGWYPLEYFTACKSWKVDDHIAPEMLEPEEWLDDYEGLLREGEEVEDDMLRGACPIQVAFPCFIPAILGSRIRVLPDNVMGEELMLSWEDALAKRLDHENPWFRKCMEFVDALVDRADGRYPLSHGAELGPTDLHAVLRGHNESIMDLIDEPEKSAELLMHLGYVFVEFFQETWKRLPLYHDGYFDAQYQVWAPGPIIRMQEDATAVFSPDLYRKLVQPVDRMIAKQFACNFIHLHSTSMFMLDAFLEIEELRCFEINIEPFNIPVAGMIEYFKMVQDADRPLLIRGSFTADEIRLVRDSLDPRGLYLHIMPESKEEIDVFRAILGM